MAHDRATWKFRAVSAEESCLEHGRLRGREVIRASRFGSDSSSSSSPLGGGATLRAARSAKLGAL
eukprot:6566785-Pyramimonas_sp.AAC.1